MPEEKRVSLSPNFYLDEFQSEKDEYKVKKGDIDPDLIAHLELMRFIGGDEPIWIEKNGGGYRSGPFNTKCKGTKNSSHKRGRAADLDANDGKTRARYVVSHTLACAVEAHAMSKEKARVIFQMIMSESFGGLGVAQGFVHIDVEEPGGNLPRKGSRPGTWSY